MRYASTRANRAPVSAAEAIDLGMVPEGGLFVPEDVPRLDLAALAGARYPAVAQAVLRPLLADFSEGELGACVEGAYNAGTFDAPDMVALAPLGPRRHVLELWHGPTAAFKDVALQIMPHFMNVAKRHVGEKAHTVILVATSGDTGKAALEGFKDSPGISIVVFYPDEGVSEIQKAQMATTDGGNTFVAAVKGNFDDCQAGVKELFGDRALAEQFAAHGCVLSSANSINWGRLCPQIVYYVHAYLTLAARGGVRLGDLVDFCVPTGNFGNILAGYYARRMGLPVRRLLCASNKNRVLADFFATGAYDRNREFFRTMSPSMDILISSNLERFLYEVTDHDAGRITQWYGALAREGRFRVDPATLKAMAGVIRAGWVDEPRVLDTIRATFRAHRYVLDTHTAVGVAVCEELDDGAVPVIIDATASPYKFASSVVKAVDGKAEGDEFAAIECLHAVSGMPVHRALAGLREKPVRHTLVIEQDRMRATVMDIVRQVAV